MYGGSRSGKSALGVALDQDRAWLASGSRHAIIRKEASSAKRSIVKDTFPTIWALQYPGVSVPQWNEQYGYYKFENDAEIWVGGLNDDKAIERILGNEYATIHGEELSEWKYDWYLTLRSRLAQTVTIDADVPQKGQQLSQRFIGTLNPTTRMHWTYRLWIEGVEPVDEVPIDREQYGYVMLNPKDNEQNLSADYLADLASLPERQRRRFYLGEYSTDEESALWRRSYIKRTHLTEAGEYPIALKRIVVAVDPAVTNQPGSDETGIVAVGVGQDGNGYVLADESGRYRPEEWARRAVSLYKSVNADRIIGEVNNGGDLIESQLRAVDPTVPYKAVRATRGKVVRAEPVAALYERGKVFHVGSFPDLEDQMCAVTIDFDSKAQGWSPDRVDALVWGMTELFPALSARQRQTSKPPSPRFSMV